LMIALIPNNQRPLLSIVKQYLLRLKWKEP
jgi:hypothetical protein